MGGPLITVATVLLGAPIGPAFGDIYSQPEVEVIQESFFFDDPSLYNANMEEEEPETEAEVEVDDQEKEKENAEV